jgi:hypothetical protein
MVGLVRMMVWVLLSLMLLLVLVLLLWWVLRHWVSVLF